MNQSLSHPVFRVGEGLRDAVAVPGQESLDRNAFSASGVIISVIRQNQDFQLPSLARPVSSAEFLEFFQALT
jgi:hypothetical protein